MGEHQGSSVLKNFINLLKEVDKISFLQGRPNRETVINGDDILNLKIALETSKDVESFLALV